MHLRQIRYVLAVYEARNFTRAAEKCGVAQPSLSNAIRRLERELGGRLFVRSAPVQPSALGCELLPMFTAINDLATRARELAAAHAAQPSGHGNGVETQATNGRGA